MRQLQELEKEKIAMSSIVQLTGAFEGIASAHIARIKTQVQKSELFFETLWKVYTQLRVSSEFRSGHGVKGKTIDKELIIIITAEGSLSGDIDMRLIEQMLGGYNKAKQDILAIGHHGVVLLDQRHVETKLDFRLPEQGHEADDIETIVQEVRKYRATTVYYQAYLSLMKQDIKSVALSTAVQERGEKLEKVEATNDYISDINYIFEPSVNAVIEHMEQSMLGVAISEYILESKLAQQASRFQAMSAARIRAKDSEQDLVMQFNHAGRAIKDERTREIVSSLSRGGLSL